MIRKATIQDASRIAEILVFTKRVNYRSIFHDDKVSFGEMQVYPLAKQYLDEPGTELVISDKDQKWLGLSDTFKFT